MTQDDLRVILNELLPLKRRIKGTHAGMVQLNRWLNPTANAWTEPMAEIILAFQKAKQIIEEKP